MTIYSLKAKHKPFQLQTSRFWDVKYPSVKAGSTKPLKVETVNHGPQTCYERNLTILPFSLNLIKSYSLPRSRNFFARSKNSISVVIGFLPPP